MRIGQGRAVFVTGLMLLAMLLAPVVSRAATPEQIDECIRRAKQYLYSKQLHGNWEKVQQRDPAAKPYDMEGGQWGATTATVLYGLLAGGESPEDPRIKPAVDFLLKADLVGTIAIGMRANVCNLLPKTAEVKQVMYKDMQFLRKAIKNERKAKGFYDYLDSGDKDWHYDHRCSFYGVLGAWACSQNMEGIPLEYWKTVDAAWRREQHSDGAWSLYAKITDKNPDMVSHTGAGVATLFMADEYLSHYKNLEAAGNGHDKDIEQGIDWISKNFQGVFGKDTPQSWRPLFSLFCVQRIAAASGYKYLNHVNWYEEGADYLVKTQYKSGLWPGGWGDSALGIVFLAYGRAPVVMNKLNYDPNAENDNRTSSFNWNQRPHDASNLTKFIGQQLERKLNWQIVNFQAPVDELHDAPILYIAGNQEMKFTDEQRDKLKTFVEQGGMIVAHADASSRLFAQSIRKLGTELFSGYEFRPLPTQSVIYTNEQFPAGKWHRRPEVLGLSNGVRELIILLPDGDPARYWQAYDVGGHSELFELMADIFQYSVDKQNLRNRGESYLVEPDKKIKTTQTIKLARIKYDGGNWDPEPGGWVRQAAVMHNDLKTHLEVKTVELSDLPNSDFKIAHLTGTGPIRFDQASRDAIKKYVEAGGILIVDAAGGSATFDQSIQQEFDAIFGADVAKPLKDALPPEHAIYRMTGKKPIEYRSFAKQTISTDLKGGGRLRLLELNGKPAIIYSPDDLSAGLVGEPIDGITGYTPQTASTLMSNILLYASGQKPR